MRLSRGTIILVVVCIVVIIGVLAFNNSPASSPGTPTLAASQQAGGPLFQGIDANTLVRFEVRDNTTGARTVINRTAEDVWGLDEAGDGATVGQDLSGVVVSATDEADGTTAIDPQDSFSVETTTGQSLDQNVVLTNIGSFLGLASSDSFPSDQLADFGLDNPRYTVLATSDDGTVYSLHIGDANPSGNRYYAVLEQLAGADVAIDELATTEEALATIAISPGESSGGTTDENTSGGVELTEIASDGGADAVATAEIVGDLEEAEALGEDIEATNAANPAATDEASATAEAGSEAGIVEGTAEAEALGNDIEATNAANPDATAEVQGEALATQMVEPGEADTDGTTEQNTAGNADLSEVTPDPDSIIAEATADVLPVGMPTPTLAPLAEPLVSLQGSQTIYTLPKAALDTLIAFITAPPIAVATAVPTSQIPLPEFTVETVPEVVVPEAEVTEAPSAEVTLAIVEPAATATPAPRTEVTLEGIQPAATETPAA